MAAAASPLTYAGLTPPSSCQLTSAWSKKFLPEDKEDLRRSVVGVKTDGGQRVEAPKVGTSTLVKPATSRISVTSVDEGMEADRMNLTKPGKVLLGECRAV